MQGGHRSQERGIPLVEANPQQGIIEDPIQAFTLTIEEALEPDLRMPQDVHAPVDQQTGRLGPHARRHGHQLAHRRGKGAGAVEEGGIDARDRRQALEVRQDGRVHAANVAAERVVCGRRRPCCLWEW